MTSQQPQTKKFPAPESKERQIHCSADLGTMTVSECLNCALNRMNVCGFDYVTLQALFKNAERRPGIHVTDLLGCPLKAFWDKTDPQPEYPHEMLARTIGTAWHQYVEIQDDRVTTELPVAWEDLTGTADIYYHDGRLVDTKTQRWLKLDRLPYASHVLQVNVYAMMLRRSGKPVDQLEIQYVDMSGPSKCRTHQKLMRMIDGVVQCPECGYSDHNSHLGAVLVPVPVYTDQEVEEAIISNLSDLRAALSMQIAPAPQPSYACSWCAHQSRCPIYS